ncbi:hypothetical protein AKUH4B114J_01010 [Apilactobacillus kunkeei]|uniref:ATP-grasp domain-containing protein n=1 Tax=Apilactobacillus TaxID=2767877 RepID=UPI001C6F7C43|nr:MULTISPECIES: ATP-grasp domain-containing protein [Apilactobacillus]MBX8454981.1 ATP-grasp domain-containing protein [Apilactobacillus kunkeei]MDN2613253.1 ATP-grasp domain-containing protein [Apilactobacillus sp. EABW-1NA]QYU54523.1 ATP-grasp domain-containing protein [Apilactobacillus kunkeei]CAI2552436.1 hypothetical protein AKUH4B102A_00910 [Apilactobacillus kunkeei]CAI2552787.1 hypothetical protein AKUH4B405J_00910 [Apilactobacillus kunkeei]
MSVVIINRWLDNFCDYSKIIKNRNIIYITNKDGSQYVNQYDHNAKNIVLDDLNNYSSLKKAVENILIKDKIELIIAMSENDIANAGHLRTDFGIKGMDYDTSKKFTNKTYMKKALKNTNIFYPKFGELKYIEHYNFNYPIVLKPKNGNSSKGVTIVKNSNELLSFITHCKNIENYEFEEYISGDIYHVDGYVSKGKLKFCKPSRYINTPLQYETNNSPLGSQLILDKNFDLKVFNFTKDVLKTLGLKNSVFHLEFIYHNGNLFFLEVGARQGGGEIVPLYKQVFGIDLVKILLKTQLLENIDERPIRKEKSGGYLLFPVPNNAPCIVNKVTKINNIKTIKYQISPNIGEKLTKNGGYYFNSGRFLFIGDFITIKKDIKRVIDEFKIYTEKIK